MLRVSLRKISVDGPNLQAVWTSLRKVMIFLQMNDIIRPSSEAVNMESLLYAFVI